MDASTQVKEANDIYFYFYCCKSGGGREMERMKRKGFLCAVYCWQ
jgi:hypothetical protein